MASSRKAQHGGKRTGAGRKPMPDEAKALLARLELLTGKSRGELLVAGLYALERELREPAKRKGPSVAREVHHG